MKTKNMICKMICLTVCALTLTACASGETIPAAGGTSVPVETQTTAMAETTAQTAASETVVSTTAAVSETAAVTALSTAAETTALATTAAAENKNSAAEQADREKIRAANQAAQNLYAAVQAAMLDMEAQNYPMDKLEGEHYETAFFFQNLKKEDNPFYYQILQYDNDIVNLHELKFTVEDKKIKDLYVDTNDTLESYGNEHEHCAVGRAPKAFTYEEAEFILDITLTDMYKKCQMCLPANDEAKALTLALDIILTEIDSKEEGKASVVKEYDGTYKFTRRELENLDATHSKIEALLLSAKEYYPKLTQWNEIAFTIKYLNARGVAVVGDTTYIDENTGKPYTPYGTYIFYTTVEDAMKMHSIDDALEFATPKSS